MSRKSITNVRKIKAGLALRGMTMSAWAAINGYSVNTVSQAINNKRNGKKSREIKEKLEKFKPLNLGQASRISGVTPAAISTLMIYLRKFNG